MVRDKPQGAVLSTAKMSRARPQDGREAAAGAIAGEASGAEPRSTIPLGTQRSTAEPAATKPLRAAEVDRAQDLGANEATGVQDLGATEVDLRLRNALHELQLAERNAVLWFDEVLRRRLFRELGFSSIYHYAGEALGFSRPRTAQFIRLCESLKELPALKSSVAAGEVSWTKAREVAKVATAQTESAWVDLARRESRRKLERRVRMAQTRSRARRRNGGRQLGLADDLRHQGQAHPGHPSALTAGARKRDLFDGDDQQDRSNGAVKREPIHDATQRESADGAGKQEPIGDVTQRESADGAVKREPIGDVTQRESADGVRQASGLTPLDVDLSEIPVTLSLRFTPEQYARYEAILEKLRKSGERADREELVLAGLEALLVESGSASPDSASGAPTVPTSSRRGERFSTDATPPVSPHNPKQGRQIPVYQIVVQQCEDCGRAQVQTSRGPKMIDPVTAEAMHCDARVLRPGERNRATIPPAVRREVMARDGHRCRTPGCGSARFLEVHHIVPRAAGGSNRLDNLVTLCSACHRLAHTKTWAVRDAGPTYGARVLAERPTVGRSTVWQVPSRRDAWAAGRLVAEGGITSTRTDRRDAWATSQPVAERRTSSTRTDRSWRTGGLAGGAPTAGAHRLNFASLRLLGRPT